MGVKFDTPSGSIYPIRHINVSFPYRGLIAIKGKSGSGKSTLLNVISSLLKPTEGKLIFNGRPISSWSEKKLSLWRLHTIGIVFQHYNLISGMNVIDNVMLPMTMKGMKKKEAKERGETLLSLVGLSRFAKKDISLLSGGERQRVAIARSLANDPSVIIADEPTGALDSSNGHSIMSLLKDISKEKLVIYVSHNDEMIERYSDEIFEIDGGHLFPKKLKEEINEVEEDIEKPHGYKSSWIRRFTASHFKNHKLKNSICFLSGLIGYSSLLLSLGFYLGSNTCIEKEQTRSLEYMKCSVSEKTYIDIENSPLRMVRRKRPTIESAKDSIEGIDGVVIAPDYSFFLPQYSAFELDGEKKEGTSFFPVYDLSMKSYDSSFLKMGEAPTGSNLDEVVVNEEFVSAFGDCIGKNIYFQSEYSFPFEGKQIEGRLSFSFLIKGVVSEFSFLNSPKVYYSYLSLDSYLDETMISETSSLKKAVVEGDDKENFTGLDYLLFAKRQSSVPLLHQRLERLKEKGSFLSIESSCYEIKTAFSSLTDAFSMALVLFVALAIVGIAVIEGMTGYSNFISKKKEAAIILSIGGNKDQINSIFVNESVTVSLLSGVISFALCPLLERAVNSFIATRFSLNGLIAIPFLSFLNIPAFLLVLLSLFSMLVAYAGTSFAAKSVKTKSLCQELKDE